MNRKKDTAVTAGQTQAPADYPYPQLLLKNQLCFPLYACARKITNAYTPFLKPFGITYTQYIVLMVLWEEGTSTVGSLGAALRLDSGTLTPLLKKLETAGYLTRSRSPEDERVVTITPTEKGMALRDQLSVVPAQIGSCISLKPEEASLLYGILYQILDN